MKYTNNNNLPEPFLNVLKNTRRAKSNTYASATSLLKSPRQFHLAKRHGDEITEDVSDNIWAILGNSLHYVLEKGEGQNDLIEEYFYHFYSDKKISGMADHFSNGVLTDYKMTSVWSVIYKSSYSDWEKQLNIYAEFYRKAGFEVKKIQDVAILRDWQKSKAKFDPNYPQSQVIVIELPLWESAHEFIKERVNLFLSHEDTPDDSLPLCTEEERWYTGDKWAVKKTGNKRALRIYDSIEEAEKALKDGQEIEYRKGESKRCEYCSAFSFCSQAQK